MKFGTKKYFRWIPTTMGYRGVIYIVWGYWYVRLG